MIENYDQEVIHEEEMVPDIRETNCNFLGYFINILYI